MERALLRSGGHLPKPHVGVITSYSPVILPYVGVNVASLNGSACQCCACMVSAAAGLYICSVYSNRAVHVDPVLARMHISRCCQQPQQHPQALDTAIASPAGRRLSHSSESAGTRRRQHTQHQTHRHSSRVTRSRGHDSPARANRDNHVHRPARPQALCFLESKDTRVVGNNGAVLEAHLLVAFTQHVLIEEVGSSRRRTQGLQPRVLALPVIAAPHARGQLRAGATMCVCDSVSATVRARASSYDGLFGLVAARFLST